MRLFPPVPIASHHQEHHRRLRRDCDSEEQRSPSRLVFMASLGRATCSNRVITTTRTHAGAAAAVGYISQRPSQTSTRAVSLVLKYQESLGNMLNRKKLGRMSSDLRYLVPSSGCCTKAHQFSQCNDTQVSPGSEYTVDADSVSVPGERLKPVSGDGSCGDPRERMLGTVK
ncbi:hypothetical protein JOB18_046151 [Solea senegalensis]|uniref:Uncharacterized protein n=1 Tax=Solea senegalensis TaxID=28829 RepID=A0AAV6RH82_SOLSE|nr:hypothetical protein JOB18_046151 [Solea senegalensis]